LSIPTERKNAWSSPGRSAISSATKSSTLLARCGFRASAECGDFGKTPIRDDSPEMIFIAEPGW